MLYLLCLLPPVAVFVTGRPIQALLNLFLTLLFYIPGVIHAILVVNEHKSDKRMKKQVKLQAKYNQQSPK
jgi:uncharacterized membrane protein YqaE (UPF0057 family)